MYLAYVDESYDEDRHWVVAVLVPDHAVNEAHRALRRVLSGFAEFGIGDEVELHAHELFHGQGGFAGLRRMPRVRIAIYAQALRCLHDCGARIIIRGVDRPRFDARYGNDEHAHVVVMTHLLERIDEFAEERNDLSLVVADEHHETQTRMLRELRAYQESGTWGYRSRRLLRVVDTIHFVRSDTNMLVQAADLVAYLHRRLQSGADKDSRALSANQGLWQIVQPLLHHTWCWKP